MKVSILQGITVAGQRRLSGKSLDRGYFNREYVKKMLDEHVSGTWNWQFQICNLLMLELWHRIFIDKAMH